MTKELNNAITDIPGIRVGHAQDEQALTGCTVVLCESGAIGGVDQRGGAPGTRETDAMHPMHLVNEVHAVVLAGGSAFGLDAASGAVRYLEERGVGFDVRSRGTAGRDDASDRRPPGAGIKGDRGFSWFLYSAWELDIVVSATA